MIRGDRPELTPYRFLPALGWMAVIFYLSHRTNYELQQSIPWLKWFGWVHFVEYALLGMFVSWAFLPVRFREEGVVYIYLLAFLICVAYGVSDEVHQMYVPTRTPSILDIINDGAGALAGVFVVWCLRNPLTGRALSVEENEATESPENDRNISS